jgi:adenylate cyclase
MLFARRNKDASEVAHRALDAARTHKERRHEAWALHLLGEVAARCDPPDPGTARRYYDEALALARGLGMQPLVAQCQDGLGTLL